MRRQNTVERFMARAIGIGGAFMKAKDPEKLAKWYLEALKLGKDFGYFFSTCRFPEQ